MSLPSDVRMALFARWPGLIQPMQVSEWTPYGADRITVTDNGRWPVAAHPVELRIYRGPELLFAGPIHKTLHPGDALMAPAGGFVRLT